MKRIILVVCVLLSLALSGCSSGRIGASFSYRKSVTIRCGDCISGENGFFVSFKKPVDGAKRESIANGRVGKGIATFRQYDKYTFYVSISRAYREKPVIKRLVRWVKKEQR